MHDAPTDGTRVLIKATVFGFVPDRQSPGTIQPIEWAPLPEGTQ